MNELVKPIQILLIGAESKSHALDQHIKFSTFTERLLNHVKNYKNLDK